MKSKIVIGTWPLSGDYGKVNSELVQNILQYCQELGINEFDTAPNYGNGEIEIQLGKVFGDDKNVMINTKIGNLPFGKKSYDTKDLKKSLEDSLNRLDRDSINTLFLHNPRNEIKDYRIVLDFLHDLKNDGMINNIGLSKAKNFDYEKVVDLDEFDVIQEDINILSLNALKKPKSKGVLMARSPLASGLLSGRITNETIFPQDDHRSGWLTGKRLESLILRIKEIKKISELDLADMAIRFLISQNDIDKIIFGIKNRNHIENIMNQIKQGPLDNNISEKIIHLFDIDYGLKDQKEYGY